MNHLTHNMTTSRRFILIGKILLLFYILSSIGYSVYAQDKIIPLVKGTVKNDTDEPLTGATISIQGTSTVTLTKKDGTFELKNVPANAVLRFSFVGHISSTLKLKSGQTEVTVKLAPSATMMAEVVVNTGLYKRPVGNFTGASKTYSGDELKMVNPSNVLKALAAVDPSIRIEQNNLMGSDPNTLPVIQLRGQNNLPLSTQGVGTEVSTPVSNGDIMSSYLSNPNQPLIILDGFQTTLQTIYDMDINRIASITVLKDAAATTAYGSKAANGVIVVETKQPLAGRSQVTYGVNVSVDAPDLTSYHLLDAEGLLEAQRLAGIYTDVNNHFNDVALKQWYDYRLQQVKSGVNTYWLSKPVRVGVGTNHSLNISGGAKAVRYSLSLNYGNGVGVVKGSDRNRFGMNYTLSYNTKNIRFSNSTNLSYSKGIASPWGSYRDYVNQYPFFKPEDSLGNVIKILEPLNTEVGIGTAAPGGIFTNAAYNAQLKMKNYSTFFGFTNNTNMDWSINNNLRLRAALGLSSNLPGSEAFYPADHTIFVQTIASGMGDLGSYTKLRGKNNSVDGRLSMDFNKKFGAHTVYTTVGAQVQSTNSKAAVLQATGLPNDYLDQLGMANGYGTIQKPSTSKNATRSISSFASVSYNYAQRYTAEVTANASGSSQFGANNRIAPFWAGGLGWNIDKEKFFRKNPVIQQLRVRATTGITGNQNFAAFLGQSIFQYNTLNDYRLQLGAALQGYANPDLKWQQTLKKNLGIGAGLFNGRLNFSLDLFEEITDNLILPLDVAPSTGFAQYQNNLGSTKNTGYELSVSAPIIRNRQKNIFWSVSFNTGHYKNVITKLSPAIELLNNANDTLGVKQKAPLARYEVGESLSRIWAVQSLGIDPATGKEVFVKRDGSKTFIWDPKDKVVCGDGSATLKGMFASNLNYKGFTFNITLSYQYGGQMYNQTLVDKIENVDLRKGNADERVLTDRWKEPGDHASFKGLASDQGTNTLQATYATSRFVQDDNFLEASSITVGYSFSPNLAWVRKSRLSAPRLFITQNNLFRFATIETERGIAYPFARSFNFGLSTTF
jgi:TonB-linked SusC/RagA family outer membrane protein